VTSLALYSGIRDRTYSFLSTNMGWTGMLVKECTALLLLGYVLARRKLRLRDLGLRWSFREAGAGLLVAAASYAAYMVGYHVLTFAHRLLLGTPARGVSTGQIFGYPTVMMLVFVLVNPFFEEMVVRAYLMTELKALTGSWTLAAALSVAVQTSYHLYYGWTLALALGFQFVAFSIYYARTRRATPIVFAHGVFDLIGALSLF
jgi:membrane protease YdiL (CAAX protease family)